MSLATNSRVTSERPTAVDLYLATENVVGQEIARRQMAVILARQLEVVDGKHSRAGGVLLGGRSGTGKTLLAETMCGACGLPFASVNATRYTEAGYAGLDLQQMFLPLIEAAARMKDLAEAERWRIPGEKAKANDNGASVLKRPDIDEVLEIASTGVVLLDEFDKWLKRENHVTGRMDTAIQADLLKMIEGSHEYISDIEDEVGVVFDTSKVLIICAGAFVGLQELVAARLDQSPTSLALWEQVTQEDLERMGLLPELAGRLAIHIFTRPLQAEHFTGMLGQPGQIIAEYRQRFEDSGCEWAVSDAGVRHIAEIALRRSTGARALAHVAWKVFGQALWDAKVAEHPCRVRFEPMWANALVEQI